MLIFGEEDENEKDDDSFDETLCIGLKMCRKRKEKHRKMGLDDGGHFNQSGGESQAEKFGY